MTDPRPTWVLVLEAAQRLDSGGGTLFKLHDLVREVQRTDSSRQGNTIRPVVQGMTLNVGKGPSSPCGKVFDRVSHGSYRLLSSDAPVPDRSAVRQSPSTATRPRRGRSRSVAPDELRARVADVIENFPSYVDVYDGSTPFGRAGQYELHRQTIDRRRAVGSAVAAIDDVEFMRLLHSTLQAWGIGRRASRLASLDAFAECLSQRSADIAALDGLSLENAALDVATVIRSVDALITELPLVDNRARIVAGTKTLHHLLPDLVPPMDRAWTGAFFGWSVLDPQNHQSEILTEAMEIMREVAGAASPSQYVGNGWRTSLTKVVDNALIGFCKTKSIGG